MRLAIRSGYKIFYCIVFKVKSKLEIETNNFQVSDKGSGAIDHLLFGTENLNKDDSILKPEKVKYIL
jgi:hypothetical protein